MPWIQKIERKKKTTPKKRNETDMRKLRQQAYQNTRWRKERDTYMSQHPLCEDCLEKGKVTAGTDCHHLVSPFKNGVINWSLLLDWNNLRSLCKECHGLRHAEAQEKKPEEILRQLDALFDNNISDEDIENGNY